MRELTQAERDGVERLIDSTGLAAVLAAVRDIANEKAEHIREAWQDASLARTWDAAGSAIGTAQAKVHRAGL